MSSCLIISTSEPLRGVFAVPSDQSSSSAYTKWKHLTAITTPSFYDFKWAVFIESCQNVLWTTPSCFVCYLWTCLQCLCLNAKPYFKLHLPCLYPMFECVSLHFSECD